MHRSPKARIAEITRTSMLSTAAEPVFQRPLFPASALRPEHFDLDRRQKHIVRTVVGTASEWRTQVRRDDSCFDPDDLAASFDGAWLRAREPLAELGTEPLRIADVFSGCGGMALGASEAVRALGLKPEHVLAVDADAGALAAYGNNYPESTRLNEDVAALFAGEVGSALTPAELNVRRAVGSVDLLLAGPPCQGNSDLNNHTRRRDPRNSLYFRVARCAEVLKARHVIVENVPGVVHDKGRVVECTAAALVALGYKVQSTVIRTLDIGVAQTRRRHILVATLGHLPNMSMLSSRYLVAPRSFKWACGDLTAVESTDVFDSAAVHSARNQERIDYLFDHDLHDLPDDQRPDCHRLKDHSYRAVYGRLRMDQPVPTVTRGFGSTGQGRFVHPLRRRSLTPHEAARLQFFPDYFRFSGVRRYALQIMIGNAVPAKLSYVVALELLLENDRD